MKAIVIWNLTVDTTTLLRLERLTMKKLRYFITMFNILLAIAIDETERLTIIIIDVVQ